MSTTKHILREIADPRGTLPDVELAFVEKNLHQDKDIYAAYTDGVQVGQIKLGALDRGEPFVVQGASVEKRGQGYGLAMYLGAAALAYDAGYLLTSDIMVSRDAAKVWERLQNRGLARIWEPFKWKGLEEYTKKGNGRAKFVVREHLESLRPTIPRELPDDIWQDIP